MNDKYHSCKMCKNQCKIQYQKCYTCMKLELHLTTLKSEERLRKLRKPSMKELIDKENKRSVLIGDYINKNPGQHMWCDWCLTPTAMCGC